MDAEPEYFLEIFADWGFLQIFEMGIATAIFLILCFLSISVSIAENGFFSLKSSNKPKSDKSVMKLLENPAQLLSGILVFSSFINIAIVILAIYISSILFNISFYHGIGFYFLAAILILILFMTGEIIPKYYIKKKSSPILKVVALPLIISQKIFYPVNLVLIRVSSVMYKRFSGRSDVSMTELSDALELTEPSVSEEKNILKGIVKFGNTYVREIMTSRVDVVAVDKNTDFKGLIGIIIESGYSRIPVFENNFDSIKGILYIKDLIPHLRKPANFEWQKLIRLPYFVPETKKIDDLLKEFQKSKIHLAIVVDEYGGSSGIITLEDILEEIVGEITDETDVDEAMYSKIDVNNYIFEGKVYLNDFYKILNVEEDIFDNIKGDADTLAGLILELKGEFPQKNDVIKYSNFDFKIISVDSRRIKKIQVTLKNKS